MASETPSPRRPLSKLRRNQESSNTSTNTLASSSNSDDPNLERTLTPPTVGNTSKFRDRFRRKSVDARPFSVSPDSGRRLSNFMSGPRNKLKKTTSNDLVRNLSVDSENGTVELFGNRSDSSFALDGSGGDSILTDGSDHEGKPVRPPLSTHPSHAGYLTLSAPEINSQTIPVSTEGGIASSPGTLPATQSTTNVPEIVEPYDIEPLEVPGPAGRNPSTSDKLREAFSLSRKKASVDADSVKSAGSGPGGGLFRASSRSNSINTETVLTSESVEAVAQPESEKSADQQDTSQVRPETPKTPKSSGSPRINTATRPETPPNLVETPTTYVTPPTPTDPSADAPTFPKKILQKSSPTSSRNSSPSRDSLKSRKINLPSKLSQSVPAPLTPTAEESKTPGGTLAQPANATGFFSSVFMAAQKAADSLSNSINTSIGSSPKSKPMTTQSREEEGGEEVIPGAESQTEIAWGEKGQSAIETLGSGDLNFRHLGIPESGGPSPMTSSADLPLQNGSVSAVDEASTKAEEEAAARAVSEAYQDPVEKVVSQVTGGGRPLSGASNERSTLGGEPSPPRQNLDGGALQRSGSVRSKISGQRKRRRRGTSGTAGTGKSIAAGLSGSASGLGNLSANGTGKRLTGFAVASSKRNKDFHQLFRSVPEDDYLIEDYSAALQRDILLHGRLYVSEGHLCFSSNILGWVTNLVISFDEIVSVEKKSTAVIFPNAIVISTLHARNTFASFVARDSTYELIIGIWKINHPNLKSSQNGVTLDNSGMGDKTEVVEARESEGSSESGSEDEVYDEDADHDAGSVGDGGPARSIAGSDTGDKTLSRQPSGTPVVPTAPQTNGIPPKGLEGADAVVAGAAVGTDFPGPPTHDPTQCSDGAEHYDRPLVDTTIPAPLGKVYSMVFGPASNTFMRKWHIEDQKSRELNLADTPLDNEHKTITFDYIKPLNAPVGPKQTKCITTYNLMAFDLEKAVTVDCSTQTPDVPSGSVFLTKTRYCLMWGPGNSTRMIANCTIEWTGKSWLKGPIEKGANDGQIEFVKSLVAALKAAVTSKPPVKGAARRGKRKGKSEVFDAEEAIAQREATGIAEQQTSDWGILEPVHGALKALIALLGPFATSQTVIAVLFALLLYTWINPPARKGANVGFPGYTSPERVAAYEEMWRREENNLWDWLEDRVGLDGVYAPSLDGDKRERQKVVAASKMGKRLDDERMNERQMDSAIKVTEHRLSALKDAIARKKEGKSAKK